MKKSDLEYEVQIEASYGQIGIDKDNVCGNNCYTLTDENGVLYSNEFVWNEGYNQEHIDCVYVGEYSETLKLKFSGKEEADGFRGIIITPINR